MCLAVPGRIVSISGDGFARSGRIDFGGMIRQVSLAYLPEAAIDDFVIVHAGIALSRIDTAAAIELQICLGVGHEPA